MLTRCLRRAFDNVAHFVKGPYRWFVGFGPNCYCRVCGFCTHTASWRFPCPVYHNSCEVCMNCNSSLRILWMYSCNPYRMSSAYVLRYRVASMINFLTAKLLYPTDPVPKDAVHNEAQVYAGGK